MSKRIAGYNLILSAAAIATAMLARPCSSPAQNVYTNNMFTQAGFVVRFADTPEKRQHLARLPADKLVTRTSRGKTYYIYADPNGCQCAYVGTPQAYQAYQNGSGFSASGPQGFSLSPEVTEDSRAVTGRTLGSMEEDAEPAQPGTRSFDDYVFGGLATD
jgi:hypothetical protein